MYVYIFCYFDLIGELVIRCKNKVKLIKLTEQFVINLMGETYVELIIEVNVQSWSVISSKFIFESIFKIRLLGA